eukprot:4297020-Amphidinium_carterae.1
MFDPQFSKLARVQPEASNRVIIDEACAMTLDCPQVLLLPLQAWREPRQSTNGWWRLVHVQHYVLQSIESKTVRQPRASAVILSVQSRALPDASPSLVHGKCEAAQSMLSAQT